MSLQMKYFSVFVKCSCVARKCIVLQQRMSESQRFGSTDLHLLPEPFVSRLPLFQHSSLTEINKESVFLRLDSVQLVQLDCNNIELLLFNLKFSTLCPVHLYHRKHIRYKSFKN